MALKVKAKESNVAFEKNKQKWAYVLTANLYNRLDDDKVVAEAAVRSGLPKPVINAAWGAIGEVIKAWVTEGHSVAIPGLGSLRFGLKSQSVADVNKVSSDLISRRYIIFTPNGDQAGAQLHQHQHHLLRPHGQGGEAGYLYRRP